MAWIESHQDLRDHPKVARLARLLDVQRTTAIGLLHHLWWWALDHAEDGDLGEYDAHDIAEACSWDGDAEALVKALLECGPGSKVGFVEDRDGRWLLHDWWQYAGKLVARRRADRDRKRAERGSPPAGPLEVPSVSDGRLADGAKTACAQNRQNQPDRGDDPAATGGAPSTRKKPATRAPESFEVTALLRSWAESKSLTLVDLAAETERFLDHHRAKGSAFSDWNAAWRTWMTRAQQYASERPRPAAVGERRDFHGNRIIT